MTSADVEEFENRYPKYFSLMDLLDLNSDLLIPNKTLNAEQEHRLKTKRFRL